MKNYTEKMTNLFNEGKIERYEATNRIHGFTAASEGATIEEYKRSLENLMMIGYMNKTEANASLQGFNDFKTN